jgi:HEAT repeat protein
MHRFTLNPMAWALTGGRLRGVLLAVLLISPSLVTPSLAAQVRPLPPRPASPPSPTPPAAPSPMRAPSPASAPSFAEHFEVMRAAEVRALSEMQATMVMERAQVAALERLAIDGRAIAEAARVQAAGAMALSPSVAYNVGGEASRGNRTEAPAPWAEQDPADSLYREARKALSGESYRRAAELFMLIRLRYPRSAYASDAPYWEAFALHRLGGEANLRLAHEALEFQRRYHPEAATRGDAAALNARLQGQLARSGDAVVAGAVRDRAERASDGCPRADEDERIAALNAVTQMDQEQALPILKKVLARREPCTQQLRRTAVMLLARRNQPEVAQTLVQVAKSDPDRDVREQAVFWMANVQSEEATELLVGLAKSGDDLELRKRAVYALARSKSPRAASTLRQIALDEREPEELRGETLQWVMSRGSGSTPEQGIAFAKELFAKAGSNNFRQRVLASVSSTRSDEARAFLVSVALNEREALELRRSAVSYISASGGWGESITAAVTALAQVYDRAQELEVRRTALVNLGGQRDNAGVDKLIEIARNEKHPELRRSAVSQLGRIKDPRAIALLQEIINK